MDFKLPDIGEGVAEGEVVRWIVAEGDTVVEDQPMVEVMTDKATVEITAPTAGTIQEIRAQEGEVVPVGSVMVVIDNAGASPAAAEPAPAPSTDTATAPASAPSPAPPAPDAPTPAPPTPAPSAPSLRP